VENKFVARKLLVAAAADSFFTFLLTLIFRGYQQEKNCYYFINFESEVPSQSTSAAMFTQG
jgi:hypothetical protein